MFLFIQNFVDALVDFQLCLIYKMDNCRLRWKDKIKVAIFETLHLELCFCETAPAFKFEL